MDVVRKGVDLLVEMLSSKVERSCCCVAVVTVCGEMLVRMEMN